MTGAEGCGVAHQSAGTTKLRTDRYNHSSIEILHTRDAPSRFTLTLTLSLRGRGDNRHPFPRRPPSYATVS